MLQERARRNAPPAAAILALGVLPYVIWTGLVWVWLGHVGSTPSYTRTATPGLGGRRPASSLRRCSAFRSSEIRPGAPAWLLVAGALWLTMLPVIIVYGFENFRV